MLIQILYSMYRDDLPYSFLYNAAFWETQARDEVFCVIVRRATSLALECLDTAHAFDEIETGPAGAYSKLEVSKQLRVNLFQTTL